MVRIRALLVAVAVCLGACGEEISPADRVLLERQKFEVTMLSWAPLPDGRIALDLQIGVHGRSELEGLTVTVQQVNAAQEMIREDLLTLDVAGMGFDDQRLVTAQVPSAGEELDALAVLLENVPGEEKRAAYPEFRDS